MSGTSLVFKPDPRVDDGVGNVHNDVAGQGQHDVEHLHGQHDREVALHQAVDEHLAKAGVQEHVFDDDGAAEQRDDPGRGDGDNRDQRVAEGVDVDDRLFPQALGARGLDIVHAQHVDHLGADIAGDAADARDGHDDDGQRHVPQRIQHIGGAGAGEAGAADAADREDRDFDRKGEDEQQRDDKAGQAVAHNRDDLHKLIKEGVLVHGGGNAQRDGDDKHDDHGQRVEHQGVHHRRADDLDDLLLVLGRVAKVAGQHVADPDQVLHHERLVQAELCACAVVQFEIIVRPHIVLRIAQHHGDRVAGHGFVDEEHQD